MLYNLLKAGIFLKLALLIKNYRKTAIQTSIILILFFSISWLYSDISDYLEATKNQNGLLIALAIKLSLQATLLILAGFFIYKATKKPLKTSVTFQNKSHATLEDEKLTIKVRKSKVLADLKTKKSKIIERHQNISNKNND